MFTEYTDSYENTSNINHLGQIIGSIVKVDVPLYFLTNNRDSIGSKRIVYSIYSLATSFQNPLKWIARVKADKVTIRTFDNFECECSISQFKEFDLKEMSQLIPDVDKAIHTYTKWRDYFQSVHFEPKRAITINPTNIQFIKQTEELTTYAISLDGEVIRYISNLTIKDFILACTHTPRAYIYGPSELRTEEAYLLIPKERRKYIIKDCFVV